MFPTQDGNRSSAEAFIHRGKPGGGGFFKPNELNSAPENINRLEIALQDIAGFALEPILDRPQVLSAHAGQIEDGYSVARQSDISGLARDQQPGGGIGDRE